MNNPSIAGMSQTMRTYSASAPGLRSLPAILDHAPVRGAMRFRAKSGADLDLAVARADMSGNRKAAGAVFAAELGEVTPTQAVAGAEQ